MKHTWFCVIRWLLLAAVVSAAGCLYSCSHPQETEALLWEAESEMEESYDGKAAEASAFEADSFKEAQVCYVHICGAVANPGVYELLAGERVYRAVERAGGFTEAAAQDYLNLAETVSDGMKLIVPTREELQREPGADLYGAAQEPEEPGKVNLNTATKEQLMTLKGIGEARAEDIIRYREESGGFQTIEDIMKVSGIKDAAFQKIKDEVTV